MSGRRVSGALGRALLPPSPEAGRGARASPGRPVDAAWALDACSRCFFYPLDHERPVFPTGVSCSVTRVYINVSVSKVGAPAPRGLVTPSSDRPEARGPGRAVRKPRPDGAQPGGTGGRHLLPRSWGARAASREGRAAVQSRGRLGVRTCHLPFAQSAPGTPGDPPRVAPACARLC